MRNDDGIFPTPAKLIKEDLSDYEVIGDPYIEAQRRLDRGEAKCTIDTSLGADISRQCRRYMGTDLRKLKEQIRTMRQILLLTEEVARLAMERGLLVAKMATSSSPPTPPSKKRR